MVLISYSGRPEQNYVDEVDVDDCYDSENKMIDIFL